MYEPLQRPSTIGRQVQSECRGLGVALRSRVSSAFSPLVFPVGIRGYSGACSLSRGHLLAFRLQHFAQGDAHNELRQARQCVLRGSLRVSGHSSLFRAEPEDAWSARDAKREPDKRASPGSAVSTAKPNASLVNIRVWL